MDKEEQIKGTYLKEGGRAGYTRVLGLYSKDNKCRLQAREIERNCRKV